MHGYRFEEVEPQIMVRPYLGSSEGLRTRWAFANEAMAMLVEIFEQVQASALRALWHHNDWISDGREERRPIVRN